MPFIPSPYLMTLALHRSRNDEEKKNEYKKRTVVKDEKEKTEKPHYPSKCKNCDYRFYSYCDEKKEDIAKIDKLIIEECNEMKDLKKRRKLLREAKWTSVNKALLKILLSDKDSYSTSAFIYENFDMSTSNFKVWELLTILAFNEDPPFYAGKIVTYDDYFKIFNRYLEYIKDLQDGKLKSIEYKQSPTDNSSDYATLILLKNFLFHFKDNENAQLLQEMLTKKSSMEDITTAINLLFEEGLLSIDSDEAKNKVKMYQ